ncbi:MAG: hypothetical protein GXX79_04605 [Actinomycetales bacterium]|nr:hypothetical protein [Actinomycetales bacterium]
MEDRTNEIAQLGLWLEEVARESTSGRFTSALTSRCPNRDPEALTLAAQRAHDLSRESYRHYQLFFASDRDLARQHMIAKEYWTAVERFLVQMGGRQPVDPDAHPPEPEPEPEPPAKRRWLRR